MLILNQTKLRTNLRWQLNTISAAKGCFTLSKRGHKLGFCDMKGPDSQHGERCCERYLSHFLSRKTLRKHLRKHLSLFPFAYSQTLRKNLKFSPIMRHIWYINLRGVDAKLDRQVLDKVQNTLLSPFAPGLSRHTLYIVHVCYIFIYGFLCHQIRKAPSAPSKRTCFLTERSPTTRFLTEKVRR